MSHTTVVKKWASVTPLNDSTRKEVNDFISSSEEVLSDVRHLTYNPGDIRRDRNRQRLIADPWSKRSPFSLQHIRNIDNFIRKSNLIIYI